MTQDRVLIRDTDHLSHFAADLSSSLTSSRFADVVLRCGSSGNKSGKGNKGNPASYPTVKVHRAVLAAMSEFMSNLISEFPLEEDIHITLEESTFDVVKRIIEFTYKGEVKIPKAQVSSVFDMANRLQIKFLKDSFRKVTDKEYAAIKAGKMSLDTLQKETKSDATFKKPVTPTKKAAEAGKKGTGKGKLRSDSDTDSAESDEEGKNAKVPGKAAISKSAGGSKNTKKKGEGVMFTLTKQEEDSQSKKVADKGKFLVHFNQNQTSANKAPTGKILPPPVVIPRQQVVNIPSPVASIKKPLPPSALSQVKKVMGPPTMIKPAISLPLAPKVGGFAPTIALASSGSVPSISTTSAPQQMLYQVQTIKQADGREIQVLKPPGGNSVMKQLKSTNSSGLKTGGGKNSKSPSRLPPKDALAIAMEAIGKTGITAGPRGIIQLPKNPVPMTRVMLPTNPVPMSVSLPAKPLPVSSITGVKKLEVSPNKSIIPVVKTGSKINPPIAILHPPGFAPVVGAKVPTKVNIAIPTPSSKHSVSQPPIGIPSTVPDDFLDDSSEASNNAAGSNPKDRKKNKARAKKDESKKPTTTKDTNKKAAPPPVEKVVNSKKPTPAKKPVAKPTPATPSATSTPDDNNVRSSGRVRKVNPKYETVQESKTTSSGSVKKAATTNKAKPEGSKDSVQESRTARKRKSEKVEEEPAAKRTQNSTSRPTRNVAKSAPANNNKKDTVKASERPKRGGVEETNANSRSLRKRKAQ